MPISIEMNTNGISGYLKFKLNNSFDAQVCTRIIYHHRSLKSILTTETLSIILWELCVEVERIKWFCFPKHYFAVEHPPKSVPAESLNYLLLLSKSKSNDLIFCVWWQEGECVENLDSFIINNYMREGVKQYAIYERIKFSFAFSAQVNKYVCSWRLYQQ